MRPAAGPASPGRQAPASLRRTLLPYRMYGKITCMRPAKLEKKIPEIVHAASTIRFSGELERSTAGSPAVLPLPRTARVTLPEGGEAVVEGVINTYPFQAVLEAVGTGRLRLRVSRVMLAGARAGIGDVAAVEITRVGKEPETRVPAELRSALAAAPKARAMWEKTTPLARRDWVLWIITGKLAETRRIRVEKGCDMLASGKRRICCFPGLTWLMKAGASKRTR